MKILTPVIAWMDLEDIMLSDKPIAQGQILYDPTYIRSLEESDS